MAPWTVSGVYPHAGPQFGRTQLTVFGSNFVNTSASRQLQVRFGSAELGARAASVVFVSASMLIVESTPAALVAGFVSVEVTCNAYDWSSDGQTFEYRAAIVVTGVSPWNGPVQGGTNVTVTGAYFVGASSSSSISSGGAGVSCLFRTVAVPITVQALVLSASQITCLTPGVDHAQTASVDVSNNNGRDYTSDGVGFRFVQPTNVTSVWPSLGPWTGGSLVTVMGNGFVASEALVCVFVQNATAAAATAATGAATSVAVVVPVTRFISAQSVVCASPMLPAELQQIDAATPVVGTARVYVSNNGGTDNGAQQQAGSSNSYANVFAYTGTPQVQRIVPARGSEFGGTVVNVTVANFSFDATWSRCRFGGADEGLVVPVTRQLSASLIQCTTPPRARGPGHVAVEVSANSLDFSESSPEVTFLYGELPTVTQLRPSSD